jgi:hypothetical protein
MYVYRIGNVTQEMYPIFSKRRRWTEHVAHTGERRRAYRYWLGKQEGKRPLGRPRHRREENSKMVSEVVGCGHGLN